MEDYPSCHTHIQTGSLIRVLRDVHKVITYLSVHWQQPCPLIPHEEDCLTLEWMGLNRLTSFPYLYSTHKHPIGFKVLFGILQVIESKELCFVESAFVAEEAKVLNSLGLGGTFLFADVEDFVQIEGASSSNDASDIVPFPYIVEEKMPLRLEDWFQNRFHV